MRRRTFVTGSLLALAGGAAAWRALGEPAPAGSGDDGEPMPDGRRLVRGAALAFGTSISVAAVHEDAALARAAVGEALARARFVDALMTVFRPESQVGRLNAEGVLERPDPHLVRVLAFAQRLAAESDGALDVTVQPLWRLSVDCRRRGRLPARDEVSRARALVDWRGLDVSPRRLALARPGMAITLNGLAQGYAADLAVAALAERGVRDALVDTGEHGAQGTRQPQQPWRLGIAHPRRPGALLGSVAMDGRFLAVSGDYATAFSADFAHHHIYDPRTGFSPPLLSSAAVAARSGLEADALTKPMMILDPERARALLARHPGAGAILVDKQARVVASQGLDLHAA
jgi:FAD:protein FMN transferase